MSGERMIVEVMDLRTGDKQQYVGKITPAHACICAYAQSLGDYNTWDYAKYESLVTTGKHTVACGDFSAFK